MKSYTYATNDNAQLDILEQGEGMPLLIIGSTKYYPRTFSATLYNHFRCLYVDHRGFSQHPGKNKEYSIETLINDIEAIRNHFSLEKIAILGHSIHAFFALEYAKQYPQYVSHCIIVANSPIAGPTLHEEANKHFETHAHESRKQALTASFTHQKQHADPFIQRMLVMGPMLWNDPQYDASHLWESISINTLWGESIWGHMFESYDTTESIENIECPIYIALGRHDYFNPPHLWDNIAQKYEQITLSVYEESGHNPQLEEAPCFTDDLVRWVKEKAAPQRRLDGCSV